MNSRSLQVRKTLIAGAIGITVLGLTAQPVFAAENIFQQVQQTLTSQFEKLYLQIIPGEKPGKLVLKQVGIASQNLKSFEGSTNISFDAKSGTGSVGSGTLNLAGPTVIGQIWDTKSYKQDLVVTAALQFQGKKYDATANVRMIDGVTYAQVVKLPAEMSASLKDVQNTWIKFEPMTASGAADMQISPAQQKKMQDAFYAMLNASDVSPAKVEQKDGGDVYVITAKISKPAVAEYLKTVQQIQAESLPSEDAAMMASTFKPEEMLQNVGEITATFWVDKGSFYPRHMELPLTVNVQQAVGESEAVGSMPATLPVNDIQTMDVKIVTDMTKHNQAFTITAPADAEDSRVFFTKMMGLFMPGLMGTSSVSPMMLPQTTLPTTSKRVPTVGTTELPTMSQEQLKALEQYEQMMKNFPQSEQ